MVTIVLPPALLPAERETLHRRVIRDDATLEELEAVLWDLQQRWEKEVARRDSVARTS